METTYTAKIEPIDGGFKVLIPEAPGLVAHGSTVNEAPEEAREKLEAYLEPIIRRGGPLPRDPCPSNRLAISVSLSLPVVA